jgi:spore maturation protein CgeB
MRIRHTTLSPRTADELELFMARSGRLSARINRDGTLLHLHSAIHPEREAEHYAGLEFWGDCIVFLGTGFGYHFAPHLKGLTPEKRILAVDYHSRCIEHCRSSVFAGLMNDQTFVSSETQDIESTIRHASDNARYIQVIKHPASYNAHPAFYDSVLEQMRFKRIRSPEAGPPLLFSGSFFLEPELARALSARGSPPAIFRYNEQNDMLRYESALSKALQESRPRYILSVNMKGFDANGIVRDLSRRFGIPVAVWFVDDPHPIMLSQQDLVTDHMFAFSWERAYLPWLSNRGFGAVHHLPLAGDPSLFSPVRNPAAKTELGFVGSAMGRTFLDEIASRFLWRPELEPLVMNAAHRLVKNRSLPLHRILDDSCSALGMAPPFSDHRNTTWLCSYIIHTASMLLRKELAAACVPLGIETFGDPDEWKTLVGDSVVTHKNIDYTNDLPAIYSSTAISLNITSCQMKSAVNQRAFDIPLCAGFVINDNQSDLHELFAPQEIAVYSSRDELLDKIAFYRRHPDERAQIAARARSAILAKHTYSHRIAALEKTLK